MPYLVVDVGDVHDVSNVVAKVVSQDPPQDVEGHVGAGVAHVGGIVDCGSARVPGDGVAILRSEHLFLASQTVVNHQLRAVAVV